MNGVVAAIDLGATSGRVAIGRASATAVSLDIVARFENRPIRSDDGLHWDIDGLFRHCVGGLRKAVRMQPDIASIGVDSWAVDYALLRGDLMIGPPFHYRDARTARGVDEVDRLIGPSELYQQNGLQFLAFNTVYQLTADRLDGRLGSADTVLLVPDLIDFWLTGERRCEATNASTTGLVDISSGSWNDALLERLRLPGSLFPPLVRAGDLIGRSRPAVTTSIGSSRPIDVVAVGSHDTASAVVAVPMDPSRAAYVSCGTWGLVGVELEAPVLTEQSRVANFTNELGVDGRFRFLHNVMGLWLLNECVRAWQVDDPEIDVAEVVAEASDLIADVAVIDVNDPRFLAPGDMPNRIAAYCAEHDLPVPQTPASITRCIVESLANGFAGAVRSASELSGRAVDTVHIVGGGAQNPLLCQLLADRVAVDVHAGPVEATAIGNVLVQARAAGFVRGDLDVLRAIVAASYAPKRYVPRTGHDGARRWPVASPNETR